jgi:hypothetical protein
MKYKNLNLLILIIIIIIIFLMNNYEEFDSTTQYGLYYTIYSSYKPIIDLSNTNSIVDNNIINSSSNLNFQPITTNYITFNGDYTKKITTQPILQGTDTKKFAMNVIILWYGLLNTNNISKWTIKIELPVKDDCNLYLWIDDINNSSINNAIINTSVSNSFIIYFPNNISYPIKILFSVPYNINLFDYKKFKISFIPNIISSTLLIPNNIFSSLISSQSTNYINNIPSDLSKGTMYIIYEDTFTNTNWTKTYINSYADLNFTNKIETTTQQYPGDFHIYNSTSDFIESLYNQSPIQITLEFISLLYTYNYLGVWTFTIKTNINDKYCFKINISCSSSLFVLPI